MSGILIPTVHLTNAAVKPLSKTSESSLKTNKDNYTSSFFTFFKRVIDAHAKLTKSSQGIRGELTSLISN